MKALNQVTLGDEAAWGFRLLIAFCVVDLFDWTTPLFQQVCLQLGWLAQEASRSQTVLVAGAVQVAVTAMFTVIMCSMRFAHLRQRLKLRDLREVDPAFAEAVDILAQRIAGAHIGLHVTSNLRDGNAFCIPSLSRANVVFGGGLRLLFRKDPDRALAIAAHELAHVHNRDSGLMIVALYAALAYGAIQMAGFLHNLYVILVRIQWEEFFRQGYSVLGVLTLQTLPFLLSAGPLLATTVVLLAALFLVHDREMYADEVAALHGHRRGIIAVLIDTCAHTAPKSMFHPTAAIRYKRIADPRGWSALNSIMLGCITFLTIRAAESFDAAIDPWVIDRSAKAGELFEVAFHFDGNTGYWIRLAGYLTAIGLGLVLVAHRVYRAGLSRLALGQSPLFLIAPAAYAPVACIVGAMAGFAFSNRSLGLTDGSTRPWIVEHGEYYLELALAYGTASTIICIAAALLAVCAARTRAGCRGRTAL